MKPTYKNSASPNFCTKNPSILRMMGSEYFSYSSRLVEKSLIVCIHLLKYKRFKQEYQSPTGKKHKISYNRTVHLIISSFNKTARPLRSGLQTCIGSVSISEVELYEVVVWCRYVRSRCGRGCKNQYFYIY
jgi:hypothetical protein